MPNQPAAARHCNAGFALLQAFDHRGAIKEFEKAIRADSGVIESHWLRAIALCQVGRAREAESAMALLRRRHRYDVNICHAHSESLLALGRGEEMERAAEEALQLDPAHFPSLHQMVQASRIAGNYTSAIAYALRALHLQPDLPVARLEVGLLLMQNRSLREGLPYYEGRHAGLARPGRRWLGEATAEPLTILAEQGLGDTIQVSRYFPVVAARAPAARFLVQPSLHGLLSRNFPDLTFIAGDARQFESPYYGWSMDLPGIFEGITEGVAQPPYLAANPSCLQAWQERLTGSGLKVGFACQGNPTHRQNGFRSIAPAEFAPLADLDGVRLVSLSIEPPPRGSSLRLEDVSRHLRDFEETAALIDTLDLVIAVDTSVAHLAGALGKETWMLLRRPYDWRWSIEGERTELYPSVRLLRDLPIPTLRDLLAERLRGR